MKKQSEYQKLYRARILADPDKAAKYRAARAVQARKWRAANHDKWLAYERARQRTYKAGKGKEQYRKWRSKERIRSRNQQLELKKQMLERYGQSCACCGETQFEFLGIDHINGGGQEERRKTGGNWYRALAKQPKRDDLRTMCHNCNLSLAHYGYCPHGDLKQQRWHERKVVTLGAA